MWFEIIGKISNIQTIAIGNSIRELNRLKKIHGKGRWRKMKGMALVKLPNGEILGAELHWYEAHGVGRKEFKIKKFLEGRTS
jgi:hypothetical protein